MMQAPRIRLQIVLLELSHNEYHMGGAKPKLLEYFNFLAIFHALNDFNVIYRHY